jgi:molybdopterin biosynthesis enzyme
VRQGAIRTAGTELVPAHTNVTAGTLALASAAGLDALEVIAPPIVGTLVLGSTLLTAGPPREGRVRDALGLTIPALIGSLGARANPPTRAPDTRDLLLQEIDDAQVDMLITTGSTSPGGGNILREALRDLGAHWLIDGILATPGAQTLLVRLPDGRLLLGLPGHPTAALAGLLTLGAPLIAGLRGELINSSRIPPSSVPANATTHRIGAASRLRRRHRHLPGPTHPHRPQATIGPPAAQRRPSGPRRLGKCRCHRDRAPGLGRRR